MGNGTVMGLLEIKNISKSFNSGTEQHVVFDSLSLSFEKGEFVTILGTSGCGKSTLLRCIGGFNPPDSGSILLDGKEVKTATSAITMVFQNYDQLFPWKTVYQNLAYPLSINKKKKDKSQLKEEVNYYLALMKLSNFADYYPHQLSGGMKQRVAISRALSLGSEVILMDEPFASLDADTRAILQVELLRLWKKTNITVLFVTHNIWEAIILGERVILLSTPPDNVKLDLKNPVDHYKDETRTPSDTGFSEFWEHLRENLKQGIIP
jgi:NitT/TauT family transport system ATP-binding protein